MLRPEYHRECSDAAVGCTRRQIILAYIVYILIFFFVSIRNKKTRIYRYTSILPTPTLYPHLYASDHAYPHSPNTHTQLPIINPHPNTPIHTHPYPHTHFQTIPTPTHTYLHPLTPTRITGTPPPPFFYYSRRPFSRPTNARQFPTSVFFFVASVRSFCVAVNDTLS